MVSSFVKIYRYIKLYGPLRTFFKVVARSRINFPLSLFSNPKSSIAIIGCGQYSFATIGYFTSSIFFSKIRCCYDVDKSASASFSISHKSLYCASEPFECFDDSKLTHVFIASNHSTHADYAITALSKNLIVYIEKPVAVNEIQLAKLDYQRKISESDGVQKLFVGYNRPFSQSIQMLVANSTAFTHLPLSLSCFVSGHQLSANHWYRNPEEGTRICGNAGHWIDLFLYLSQRGEPSSLFTINILPSDIESPDDNFSLSIISEKGDLFNLMLTSRSEPFEGINETINFQQGDVICKIDDFKKITIWNGSKKKVKRFFRKDVGHRGAITQPLEEGLKRSFDQILDSTILILAITNMINDHEFKKNINLVTERIRISNLIN